MTGFVTDIEDTTLANDNFRQVVFTGFHSQLVLMCLQPGEDIGMEVHSSVDQFFRFEFGEGKVVLEGVEYVVKDGMAVVVPAGTNHNVINTSDTNKLKFYTIYSPANHRDGVVHQTKAIALADTSDEIDDFKT